MKSTESLNPRDLDAHSVSFLLDDRRRILDFISGSRNADGGWGRLKGAPSEVRSTALAVLALMTSGEGEYIGPREEGVQFLLRTIRVLSAESKGFDSAQAIEETALVAEVLLTTPGIKHESELSWCLEHLASSQASDGGWNHARGGTQQAAMAARALALADNFPQAVSLAAAFIESIQNGDGGWGASQSLSSSIGITAHAIRMLVAAGHRAESRVVQSARSFLTLRQNANGSWSETSEGDVYHTALCIMSMTGFGTPIQNEGIRNAVSFLEGIQDDDGGWGWKGGDTSQTEPTTYAFRALVAAGAMEYVPLVLVRASLARADEESKILTDEVLNLRHDMDARVREQIPSVVAERNRLAEELNELRALQQTESKRHAARLRDVESEMEAVNRDRDRRFSDIYDLSHRYLARSDALRIRMRTLLAVLFAMTLVLSATILLSLSIGRFSFEFGGIPRAFAVALLAAMLGIGSYLGWRLYRDLSALGGLQFYITRAAGGAAKVEELLPETPDSVWMARESQRLAVERAFDRIGAVMSTIPRSERMQILQAIEELVLSPPDARRFAWRHLVLRTSETVPRSLAHEIRRSLEDLSRYDGPHFGMEQEYVRFRERYDYP